MGFQIDVDFHSCTKVLNWEKGGERPVIGQPVYSKRGTKCWYITASSRPMMSVATAANSSKQKDQTLVELLHLGVGKLPSRHIQMELGC